MGRSGNGAGAGWLALLVAWAPAGGRAADGGSPSVDAAVVPDAGPAEDSEDDEDGPDDDPAADGEEESAIAPPAEGDGKLRYTTDINDANLARRWRLAPETLGSISVGFADAGRIINGVQVPPGDGWTVVSPELAYGLQESVDGVMTAITEVRRRYPDAPRLRVNHISRKDGGYLRPHQSHQAGRDVDLAFYYRAEVPAGLRGGREKLIDARLNWALIRALCTLTDTQVILVDRRIQRVLVAEAVAEGEDRDWVESLFTGPHPLVRHARRHRDHFHVRFYAPRSQELGRRVQPLLAQRPDQNLVVHRVRSGQTVSHIARKYDTTITAIMKANGMKRSFLRVGQTLAVPLRGPCTQCPMPPDVLVPPRRLPPGWAGGGDGGVHAVHAGRDAEAPSSGPAVGQSGSAASAAAVSGGP